MIGKIFESELKVLELIWANEPVSAKEISVLAEKNIGWNKNTTYTVITKLEEKGYIKRSDPGFVCTSLISKSDVQKEETNGLLVRLFGGSKKALFSALLEDESLSEEEIRELRNMIEKR
jgi:predicted transcriptional regulator